MIELWTIGYERRSVSTLIALLHDAGIDEVADIRARPTSRRADIRGLPDALVEAGIAYSHLPSLGAAPSVRSLARAGRMLAARRAYLAGLETVDAKLGVLMLTNTARAQRVCLLCYEADHRLCHRHWLTQELLRSGEIAAVHHLPEAAP